MTPKRKLTFISLCYNHADYVEQHMDAVAAFFRDERIDMQWIIVDDFSGDHSQAVIAKWISEREHGPHHFIRHNENRGVSSSLNEALALATGDYIKILATDDLPIRDALIRQLNELAASPPESALSCSNFIKLLPGGSKTVANAGEYSFPEAPYRELLRLEAAFIHTATLIYRKELFARTGYFNESLKQEDYDMLLRITREFEVIYYPEVTVIKRELPGSLGAAMYRIEQNNREVLHVLRGVAPRGKGERAARLAGICKWAMNYLSNTAAGYEGFSAKSFARAFAGGGHFFLWPAPFFARLAVPLAYSYLNALRRYFIKMEKS